MTKLEPLVSVIIAAYNVAPYLGRCLDSVCGQTHCNLEILVIDDGSTDETAGIAARYAERDPRIRLIRQDNHGISYTRNVGITEARGDWFSFVDSDDVLDAQAIAAMLEAAVQNRCNMCIAEHYVCINDRIDTAKRVRMEAAVCRDAESAQAYFLTKGKGHCFSWGKLFHRFVYSELRYPVGRIYEDIWLMPRILDAAGSCVVLNRPLYYYFLRGSSLTYVRSASVQMQALEASQVYVDYIRDHYPALTPDAETRVVESCLYLMGRICRVGRRRNRTEWERAVSAMGEHSKNARLDGVYLKTATALFRLSPVLVGHLCNLYSLLKNKT